MKPDNKTMARLKPGCICMGIKLYRLLDAIEQGASSFDEIARITGIGQGDCGGERCRKKVEELLQSKDYIEYDKTMSNSGDKINIIRIVTGEYRVNTYIVSCVQTKHAVIIDPGGNPEIIVSAVRENELTVDFILNTHGHADHGLANNDLKTAFAVPICMHKDDDIFFANPAIRLQIAQELGLPIESQADVKLTDGDILTIGDIELEVIHTPGHSPGSVCFFVEGNLFTGDTLFVGDVGRSDLAGGSFDTLLQSIKERILPLPADTIVRPGHDYGETPKSTLAWEMKENPYITDFILADEL